MASQLLRIVSANNNNQTNFANETTQLQHHASYMNDKIKDDMQQRHCCLCPLMPLYLQWEGHSVTIVGVERYTSPTSQFIYDLLVFDPMKFGTTIKESITLQVAKEHSLGAQSLSSSATFHDKKCNNSNNPGEKCHSVYSSSLDKDHCISEMRLPVKKLYKKDCQIVLCSKRQLPHIEREKTKETTNALTAAHEAVAKSLKSNGYK